MTDPTHIPKPLLVIVGQTPPPWHGQAVATQLLFEAEWKPFEVRRIRMAFSEDIEEIGRFQTAKLFHIFALWGEVRKAVAKRNDAVLLYPPASPNWIPLLRDLLLLPPLRRRFHKLIYIYHAGGFGEWCASSRLRLWIAKMAYGTADLSLEVATEALPPHEVLRSEAWAWTPYGVKAPTLPLAPEVRSGPTVVLFVGSLQEGKGVLEVLETARALKDAGHGNHFRFRLVGSWFSEAFRAEAIARAASLEIADMVEYCGQLTGDDKWQAYHQADVFFFPTHYESEAFPLVLIEALGCGLPLVTTRWRGIPELLDGCTVASLFPTRSPLEYGNALLHWRSQKHRQLEISAEARRFYEQRYLPSQFLSQVEALICETVGVDHPQDADTASDNLGIRSFRAVRRPAEVRVYLADQNPNSGRSLGISRMTQSVLTELSDSPKVRISAITSKSSLHPPNSQNARKDLPWGTKNQILRVLTDHLHPLLTYRSPVPDLWYYPKGFLPRLNRLCSPSVVTIHDTIIQYYSDHYPRWRTETEYSYWAYMLKHTLRHATGILTVSESSKDQIVTFMQRHGIPPKEIHVTYEPCLYEAYPQPVAPAKAAHVLHLGSREPHKRTGWLIRQWIEEGRRRPDLPALHVIGSVPTDIESLASTAPNIVRLPFLDDAALISKFTSAKALILPSEIEGFGLPAIEAFYLGTPVCFTLGTSIEEVLEVATRRGGFSLEEPTSLFAALDDVMSISPEEIYRCGMKLRETYAARSVVERMMSVFETLKR